MNGWPYWVLLVSYLLQLTAFWFLLRSHNRLLDVTTTQREIINELDRQLARLTQAPNN